MGTTPTLLLPYPEPTDPADVPTDMNELATRIETVRGAANGLASLDSAGKVPVAQIPAALPGAELAYAERTSNMTVSTTPASAATAPPVTLPATTIVWVEFYAAAVVPPAAQDLYLHLYVDGAAVAVLAAFNGPTYVPTLVRRRLSAAAGSRTFGVFASVSGGSGTISANTGTGGANAPAYIRVAQG